MIQPRRFPFWGQPAAPIAIALVGFISSGAVQLSAAPSYADLTARLVDLERLALLPPEGEIGAEATSYARQSRYDPATDRYIDWSHNSYGGGIGDGTGVEAIDAVNKLVTVAEIPGPGVIWRMWSARPSDNPVRFYLDDAEVPAIDLPFSTLFDPAAGPFQFPELVYDAARGKNTYVPIPFQRSFRVVTDTNGFGRYFHFGYTRFPPGTRLPAFRLPLGAEELTALTQVNRALAGRGEPLRGQAATQTRRKHYRLAPGGIGTFELKGEGAVTELRVEFDDLPADSWAVLRQLTLSIYWDGEKSPSVWSPLGDFFGTAPGWDSYRSLPMGVTDSGGYSRWFMPYAKGARVEIANEGPTPFGLTLNVTVQPLSRPIGAYTRFHAKWHRDAFLPEHPDRRAIDWTILKTRGRGRYCGMMLHVWNPAGGWWGEGDEKFFVDGEKFPSSFGTGTEDYFGYAWGDPTLFSRPFHSQTFNTHDPKTTPGQPGWKDASQRHATVNRWHIADDVPFQRSFEAALEKYYSNERGTIYAGVAYWYLSSDGHDPYTAVPVEERTGYFHR